MTAPEQLELDLSPLLPTVVGREATIDDRFAAFHAANPHVADVLERLARQWLQMHPKVGIKALVERARWESGLVTAGSAWRIDNTLVSRYARLLVDRNPHWADAIERRELRSA